MADGRLCNCLHQPRRHERVVVSWSLKEGVASVGQDKACTDTRTSRRGGRTFGHVACGCDLPGKLLRIYCKQHRRVALLVLIGSRSLIHNYLVTLDRAGCPASEPSWDRSLEPTAASGWRDGTRTWDREMPTGRVNVKVRILGVEYYCVISSRNSPKQKTWNDTGTT